MDWNTVFKFAWNNRNEVLPLLKSLKEWYRKKERPILMIGPGGVGKTTLGAFLAGKLDWRFGTPWKYTESLNREVQPLQDDPRVELVIPPGQKHRRDRVWTTLQADIASGKYRGIILMGAFGYHTLGETVDYKKMELAVGRTKTKFVEVYLQECRNEEICILRQLVPHIQLCTQRMWLLSLVAKQDLWWDERDHAERFYTGGEYLAALAELAIEKDSRHFRHEYAFASVIINNFTTSTGEILSKTVAGYDTRMQVESMRRLLEKLMALKDWEDQR